MSVQMDRIQRCTAAEIRRIQAKSIRLQHRKYLEVNGYSFKFASGMYDWLRCTRYKPPKLKRTRRQDGVVRRKLGRNPRIPFSSEQVLTLENKFRENAYLSCADVAALSSALRLSEIRIKIWFQNRRARERREREAGTNNSAGAEKTGNDVSSLRKCQPLVTSPESAFVPCRPLKLSRSPSLALQTTQGSLYS
ncbi:uncharacterized protein [Bemisia tabaci]|uniref:uncharacterized protein n=1 Tax=Bemisia tabaci TaxID=7038 RepID=UPI003B27E92D